MFEVIALILIILIVLTLIVMLGRHYKNRLGVRIALLILGMVPLVLVSIIALNIIYYGSVGQSTPGWLKAVQMLVVVFGTPLLLGWLASRYVTKPLKDFMNAITSLKRNDYDVELHSVGITEFDKVFEEFNDLRQRLHREEELRKDLISDTSHELNTPLMALSSQLSAIEDGVLELDAKRIGVLKAQAERLKELVTQLDAYTKARSPGAYGRPELISLQLFCEKLVDSLAPLLTTQHMHCAIAIADDIRITASERSLEQILTNLIQNAIRYSHGTTITIHATTKHLILSDDGAGVPEESLDHLFDRFYRVEHSRSRDTGGLGLGLAITQELVHGQGWRIEAANGHPGLRITILF